MAEKSNNQKFLESLSDDQLREEIKYGSMLSGGTFNHTNFHRRELREAQEELERRKGNG